MKKTVLIILLITVILMSVYLVSSCMPPSVATKSDGSQSRIIIEMYGAYGYSGIFWKLYDPDTGTLCYAHVEGGIDCKFQDK